MNHKTIRFGMVSILMLCAVVALGGCSLNHQVPHTTITGKVGGQPFSLETPKDCDLHGLDVGVETNGTMHVKLKALTTKMNPDVVTSTGQAQAAIINATGDVVIKATKAAGSAAAAAAK